MSVAPIVMRSPSVSVSRVIRRPFSSVPLVEPRSTTTQTPRPARPRRDGARRCRRRRGGRIRGSGRSTTPCGRDRVRTAVERQRHDLARRLGSGGLDGRRRSPVRPAGRPSSSRRQLEPSTGSVAVAAGTGIETLCTGTSAGRRGCRQRGQPVLGLRDARRDPELADREVVVGREPHAGRRQQGVRLASRVLGQVLLELADQRALVRGELLPVGARRGRSCTRSARRRARPRPSDARPSPWRACGRARPAGRAFGRRGRRRPRRGPRSCSRWCAERSWPEWPPRG